MKLREMFVGRVGLLLEEGSSTEEVSESDEKISVMAVFEVFEGEVLLQS